MAVVFGVIILFVLHCFAAASKRGDTLMDKWREEQAALKNRGGAESGENRHYHRKL